MRPHDLRDTVSSAYFAIDTTGLRFFSAVLQHLVDTSLGYPPNHVRDRKIGTNPTFLLIRHVGMLFRVTNFIELPRDASPSSSASHTLSATFRLVSMLTIFMSTLRLKTSVSLNSSCSFIHACINSFSSPPYASGELSNNHDIQ
ncbi:hypothetical protein ACN47E_001535 [Coniothyrium glycines]